MHRILEHPAVAEYERVLGRETVKRAINATCDRARFALGETSLQMLVDAIVGRLERRRMRGLLPVINATGILIHTNLGRAPLAASALEAMQHLGAGYSNLEFDLESGGRSSRYERISDLVSDLVPGTDALVVNNCAAAMLLIFDTLARRKEVIVSRGELIEIGGGFRLPDVLERSGATLVEVGATNKTYVVDVRAALTTKTALLLRSHTSNYSIEGFVHPLPPQELARLGNEIGIPVIEDLGSGALTDLTAFGLTPERTIGQAIADGMDLVVCSGDKLLGGPQCGVIIGKAALISRLRSNPLLRALRVDKMTLAAMGATLALHRSDSDRRKIPVYTMLATTSDELSVRANRYCSALEGAHTIETTAYVGGGTLAKLSSLAVALPHPHPEELAARLRHLERPIISRIADGESIFELRTIAPSDDDFIIATIQKHLA